MNTRDRFLITLMLCLTIVISVWLHAILTRYEVIIPDAPLYYSVRYDRITGRVWVLSDIWTKPFELGVKREQTGGGNQSPVPERPPE